MNTQLALNSEIFSSVELNDGKAPEWVELIPTGPTISGRDGRSWLFDDTAIDLVQSSFTSRAIDLPIDWEHATQHRATVGQDAPAGAWIKQLDVRDGALWGQVEWTPRAALQVENREYRFLSPVFDYVPDNRRIVHLISAGLTNKPNFLLTALNQEAFNTTVETTPVQLPAALLALLGLPETATPEQALTAASQLKATAQALNSEHTNLERFVPREDYNALLNRANNAEQQLESALKAEHAKAVEAALTAATQSGKVTPATVEYHRAICQDLAGLERFKAYMDAAPVVADTSGLEHRQAPQQTLTALNSEERAMCQQLGVDPVEFAKNKQSETESCL